MHVFQSLKYSGLLQGTICQFNLFWLFVKSEISENSVKQQFNKLFYFKHLI